MARELVGEAFVRITADTTAMRRAIHRAGREDAAGYTSEFGKEVERTADAKFAGARRALAEAIVGDDFQAFIRKGTGNVSQAIDDVRDSLQALRDMGKLNAKEFDAFNASLNRWAKSALVQERAEADAKALEGVRKATREARQEFETLDKAHTQALREDVTRTSREVDRLHTLGLRLNREWDQSRFGEILRDAANEAARLNQALSNKDTITFGKRFDEARVSVDKLKQGLTGVDALVFKVNNKTDDTDRSLRRTVRSGQGLFSVFGGINKTLEGMAHRGNPLVDLFVAPLRAGSALAKLVEGTLFRSLTKVFAGSKFAGPVAGLGASLVAAGVGITVMVKGLSLLASGLSLVAGMAGIAASAIGGGLVGGIVLLAGSLPAVLVGVGALALAFANIDEVAPEATEKMKTFGKEFQKALQTEALKDFTKQVDGLLAAIKPFSAELARSLGGAVSRTLSEFVGVLVRPDVQKSLGVIFRELPKQVEALGSAFAHFTGGIIGFFSGISPFVTRFLQAVAEIGKQFDHWANSVEGQSAITKFMQRVVPLAESLWKVLVNVGKAIAGVFNAAVDGGTAGRFLDFLVDVTGKFATFINSAEGQNKLKAWFEEAYKAGQAIGSLIQGIGAVFGALDTSKSREQITKLTDGIGNFLTRHAPDLEKFVGFIDRIGDSFSKINFKPFLDLAGEIGKSISTISDALKDDAFAALDTKFQGFNNLADTVKDDLLPAFQDFRKILDPVVTLLGSTALKNLASSWEGVAEIIDGVTLAFSGLLNIITGILTFDQAKIAEGVRQSFESAGKIAFGAFEAAFAGSGIKGILDKVFNLDSTGVNFDTLKTQVSDFFSGFSGDAESSMGEATESTTGFFDDLGQKFTDARLEVGKFFDESFSLPTIDFTAINQSINDFFLNLGATISGGFETARLAIGKFFTDWATEVATQTPIIMSQIGQFFNNLPFTIAAALGAAAGIIVNFFYEQWNAVFLQFETVVIPWFQGLPERLGGLIQGFGNFLYDWFFGMWNGVFSFFEVSVVPWFQGLPERLGAVIESAEDFIGSWFSDMWNTAFAYFENTVIPWVKGIPERLGSLIDSAENFITSWFSDMWNGAFSYFNNTVIPFFRNLPQNAKNAVSSAINWLRDWVVSSWTSAQNYITGTVIPFLGGLPSRIASAFSNIAVSVGGAIASHMKGVVNGLIAQINTFIANFNNFSPFDIPYMRYLAEGGMIDRPTIAMMGEGSKREAVVPLDRPLSLVNPSVRDLAAFAQGKFTFPESSGKTITFADGAIRVSTPYADPEIVTQQVVDRIVEEVFG